MRPELTTAGAFLLVFGILFFLFWSATVGIVLTVGGAAILALGIGSKSK